MITLLTILGFILVIFLAIELILFLLSTCWWLGVIIGVLMLLGFIDYTVVKHGLSKLFEKKD